MKWIKASERQPTKKGVYKIKGLNNQGNPVEDNIWWTGLDRDNGFIIREGCKILEWLDESVEAAGVQELEKWRRSYIEWFFNHSPYFPIPNEQADYIDRVLLSPLQKRITELETGIKKAMQIRSRPYGSGDYEILKELIKEPISFDNCPHEKCESEVQCKKAGCCVHDVQ